MEEPQGATGLCGSDKEWSVIGRAGYLANLIPQYPLNERPSAITLLELDQVVYLFCCQIEWVATA